MYFIKNYANRKMAFCLAPMSPYYSAAVKIIRIHIFYIAVLKYCTVVKISKIHIIFTLMF